MAKTNQIHRLGVLANGAAVNTSQTQLYPPLMPHLSVSSRVKIIECKGVNLWERNIARDIFNIGWPDMTNPFITKAPVYPEGGLDKYLSICEQLDVWNPDPV